MQCFCDNYIEISQTIRDKVCFSSIVFFSYGDETEVDVCLPVQFVFVKHHHAGECGVEAMHTKLRSSCSR